MATETMRKLDINVAEEQAHRRTKYETLRRRKKSGRWIKKRKKKKESRMREWVKRPRSELPS